MFLRGLLLVRVGGVFGGSFQGPAYTVLVVYSSLAPRFLLPRWSAEC